MSWPRFLCPEAVWWGGLGPSCPSLATSVGTESFSVQGKSFLLGYVLDESLFVGDGVLWCWPTLVLGLLVWLVGGQIRVVTTPPGLHRDGDMIPVRKRGTKNMLADQNKEPQQSTAFNHLIA